VQRDQVQQLERLSEVESGDFARRRDRDEVVAALDRPLEDRPRMSLRSQRVPFRGRAAR
jgi:hypothetical protein